MRARCLLAPRRLVHARPAGDDRPLRCLFFGTDDFSLHSLQALVSLPNRLVSHVSVVVPPPPKTGRHAVAAFADAHGLPVLTAPAKTLKSFATPTGFDLGVVASFGYFIPARVIASLRLGAVNVHPSLLPRYRGAAPLHHTILNGDRETGVTLIDVDASAFDVGLILRQARVPVPPDVRYATLRAQLGALGAQLLLETIPSWNQVLSQAAAQGSASAAPRAPKIEAAATHVRWDEMSADQIWRMWRAFADNYGLHCTMAGRRVRLVSLAEPCDQTGAAALLGASAVDMAPGTLVWTGAQLWAVCAQRSAIRLEALHVQNKRPISSADFANGYRLAAVTPRALQ